MSAVAANGAVCCAASVRVGALSDAGGARPSNGESILARVDWPLCSAESDCDTPGFRAFARDPVGDEDATTGDWESGWRAVKNAGANPRVLAPSRVIGSSLRVAGSASERVLVPVTELWANEGVCETVALAGGPSSVADEPSARVPEMAGNTGFCVFVPTRAIAMVIACWGVVELGADRRS